MALPRRLVRVFLSTPSARRATARATSTQHPQVHFYPRPPRGGRRDQGVVLNHDLRISIHALREEGDWSGSIRWAQHSHFYPRPPRGGRRILYWFDFTFTEFLSTPSARRATHHSLTGGTTMADFYPRPPRGGRLCNAWSHGVAIGISIHALREEGDHTTAICLRRVSKFLSTPSARRATMVHQAPCGGFRISIHALREEGDTIRTETRR